MEVNFQRKMHKIKNKKTVGKKWLFAYRKLLKTQIFWIVKFKYGKRKHTHNPRVATDNYLENIGEIHQHVLGTIAVKLFLLTLKEIKQKK